MSTTAKSGQTVSVHYTGTLTDGTEFDSSRGRGAPLTFTIGSGQLINGFDTAVAGMTVGETKDITLTPAEAYGEINEEATQTLQKDAFPSDFEFVIGGRVQGHNGAGQPVLATIKQVNDDGTIVMDMNHPLAGKTLNFNIELVEIDDTENTTTE